MWRDVDRRRHLLHLGGGAWAFLADLIDLHPEVEVFRIEDKLTGEFFETDRETMERHSWRRDLGAGMQVILPLDWWRVNGAPARAELRQRTSETRREAVTTPSQVQLPLAI